MLSETATLSVETSLMRHLDGGFNGAGDGLRRMFLIDASE